MCESWVIGQSHRTHSFAFHCDRVRLAAIEALSEAPEGSSTASQPLIKSLEDDDREVRNAAADALAKILARNDLKLKFMLVRIVAQNTAGQIAIGAGCQVGSKYMSLEVRTYTHVWCSLLHLFIPLNSFLLLNLHSEQLVSGGLYWQAETAGPRGSRRRHTCYS